MASHGESSSTPEAATAFSHGARGDDEGDVLMATQTDVDTVPRVFESAAGLPPDSRRDGEPKGKGRAQDRTQDRAQDCAQDCKVEEPLTFGETGPQSREVHEGITMCCTATQVSPFTLKGKMFFAVHFDDDTFVSNVTFENCVLINVSFRGCMLSDVRFINVHLEEAEFVACDFNNFTWLSASESERTWQGETFESYLMGDEIPEQISDPQWTVRKMEEQTIPDRTGDPGPQWIADRDAAQTDTDEVPHGLPTQTYNYHVFIDEQAPHVANSHDQSFGTVQNQYCGPNGYDFSGLGNMVRPAYANGVEKSRVETIISEWHDFADQMEAERQRERDQKALQEARVKSAEEAATDAAHIRSPQRGVPDFVSCSSSASMDMSGSETQQSSPDPPQASRVSTTDFRSSLQNTGWNAQASQLPPHLHETFTAAGSDGQAEGLQDGCGDDDDDDDDGPVYRPAARLRR